MYTHQPLADPGKQIRLLEYLQNEEDEMHLRLTTWYVGDAPDYLAISYTWGTAVDHRTMLINNEEHSIGANCYYALTQVRSYNKGAYIWVDAICTNQGDIDEKTLQVQMMYEIFSRAEKVLSCVGPHADHSEILTRVVQDLPHSTTNLHRGNDFGYRRRNDLQIWALAQEKDYLVSIFHALHHFANRRYWTRVWIIQEVFNAISMTMKGGENSLYILYGHSYLTWVQIDLLVTLSAVVDWLMQTRHGSSLGTTLSPLYACLAYPLVGLTIDDVFKRFGQHGCTDPRDHLFVVISIIEWRHHLPAPKVDYRKSTLELATEVISFLKPGTVKNMLQVFELLADFEMVMRELSRRRLPRFRPTIGPDACQQQKSERLKTLEEIRHVDPRFWASYSRITRDLNGKVTAHFTRGQCKWFFIPEDVGKVISKDPIRHGCWTSRRDLSSQPQKTPETLFSQNGREDVRTFRTFHPHPNFILPNEWVTLRQDNDVAALLCSQAHEGDFLLALENHYIDPDDLEQVLLVIRSNGLGRFDIIDQGFTVNGYHLAKKRSTHEDAAVMSEFLIEMSPLDLILFVHQDSTDCVTYRRWDRALRLVTAVTSTHSTPDNRASDDPIEQ